MGKAPRTRNNKAILNLVSGISSKYNMNKTIKANRCTNQQPRTFDQAQKFLIYQTNKSKQAR